MSAKTRVQLSNTDRKVICELVQSNRDLTHAQLTRLCAERLSKPDLGRSTVTGTLQNSAKWLQVQQGKEGKHIKHRKAQHEDLEQVLMRMIMHWFGNRTARGASMLDRLMIKKAKAIAIELNIENFMASDGWLAGFRQTWHQVAVPQGRVWLSRPGRC